MGIIVPIWNINFFLIHISSNEMAKADHNAFYQSQNLEI